jgi:hypothetical protein
MVNLFRKLYHATFNRPVAKLKKSVGINLPAQSLPFKDYTTRRNDIKFVDPLSDDELKELNHLLNWNCFVVDAHGRRFGSQARPGKRSSPQPIPDRRLTIIDDTFKLANKHVLEVGCFEGIHTIGLCQRAKQVTACDSRIENVVKTIVRCALFDYHPTVFKYNLEDEQPPFPLDADVMHHIGVLYHLKDPVSHLLSLGHYIREGIMLDTHYALDQDATESYTVQGQTYPFKRHREGGYQDVFSGMYDFARWLTLNDLTNLLQQSGFEQVDIIETREERNGPRVLLIAKRI